LLCGANGNTAEKWLPLEWQTVQENFLYLPKSNLLPGSIDVELRLEPEFEVNAFLASDYDSGLGYKAPFTRQVFTHTPITADNDTKTLRFNGVDGNAYVIKAEQNKFWKNVKYLNATYQ
jgi:hypothetical protein